MAESSEQRRAALEQYKRNLEQAAVLHPLSAACVQLADTLLSEVVNETVYTYAREHASSTPPPLPAAAQELLEGWTAEQTAQAAASGPLRTVLELEAEASALRALKQTASSTEDVFGNRHKQTSDTIVCTNCATQVSANRYAPHLERCMLGRGRASARAARDSMRGSE